jgi:hypothetical protein
LHSGLFILIERKKFAGLGGVKGGSHEYILHNLHAHLFNLAIYASD